MIYLDNAATSFPKPDCVKRAVWNSLTEPLGNPGRSGHSYSKKSADIVFSTRESLARLLQFDKPENIVFTSSATHALNLAILGSAEALREKTGKSPLVVTDAWEHNSVLRPLFLLERKKKIRLRILNLANSEGFFHGLLTEPPQMAVFTLRSNVTGQSPPFLSLSRLLAPYGTLMIADASQILGHSPLSFSSTGAHILCAPGHKGLLGIMGSGFLAVHPSCPILPEPIFTGGSGNESFSPRMPSLLPERLEAGTLPLPAIAAMGAGADYLMQRGLSHIQFAERRKKKLLIEGLSQMPQYRLYAQGEADGPVLFNRVGMHSEDFARYLGEQGLMVRGGFHCAPLMHRWLGTEEQGGVRLSPGIFTTDAEIYEALRILSA